MIASGTQTISARGEFEPVSAISRVLDGALVVCSLAAVTAFIAVGINRPVWLDEANGVLISSHSFTGIVAALRNDNNFPLYYFLLAVWMRLLGDSEVSLRLLSAIFYVSGGAAAFVLGRRIRSSMRTAGYAAFFYLASAIAIRQAQNIRMYALLGMLCGLSILSFIRLFFDDDRSPRAKALFIVVHAAGLLTHFWFAFVVVAQLLILSIVCAKRIRAWLILTAAAAVPFLVFWSAPLLDQLRNGATAWMPSLQPGALIVAPLEFYGFFPGLFLYGLVAGAWVLASRSQRQQLLADSRIRVLLLLFVTSLVLPLLVSIARPVYAPGRYAIIALPPLAVLLAAVFTSVLPRPILPMLAILLLVSGATDQIAHRDEVLESELPPGQSDRATAQFLLEHAAPQDAIVFTSLTRAAADYYLRRAHAQSRFIEISFPAETLTHLGWNDPTVSPERRAVLESEADATTARLLTIIAAGHRVWLYSGGAPAVTAILQRRLESVLPHPREHPLWGPYHRSLLEFGAAFAGVTKQTCRS